ncbi:hypothetical protein D3C86_1932890 [compost metagenome]
MQRLQGFTTSKITLPIRITFQVSSSQAALPATTRFGRNCSICTLAVQRFCRSRSEASLVSRNGNPSANDSGTAANFSTRRVSSGPTQRNCTGREKYSLSQRLISSGAIRAVK